jgi:hypothetical protein
VLLREAIDRIDVFCATISHVGVRFVTRPAMLFPQGPSTKETDTSAVLAALGAATTQACAYIAMHNLQAIHYTAISHSFSLFGIAFSLATLSVFDVVRLETLCRTRVECCLFVQWISLRNARVSTRTGRHALSHAVPRRRLSARSGHGLSRRAPRRQLAAWGRGGDYYCRATSAGQEIASKGMDSSHRHQTTSTCRRKRQRGTTYLPLNRGG